MHPLESRLSERAAAAGLALNDSLRARLLAYHDVLFRWNARINLTALTDPDEAIDRLLLEPVAAAGYLRRAAGLMDLGSGGGSPAIPLALALDCPRLVMVESKQRKAAFLREAARIVEIPAVVEAERFEVLADAGRYSAAFGVVSMRAVRMDFEGLSQAAVFLEPGGRLALFVSAGTRLDVPQTLIEASRAHLVGNAELAVVSRHVPRGT